MPWWKRETEPEPEPTYSCTVYPNEIPDSVHDFDGISVSFLKPGWNWQILQHRPNQWDRVWDVGKGYNTRDAALIDLLKRAKEVDGEVVVYNVLE